MKKVKLIKKFKKYIHILSEFSKYVVLTTIVFLLISYISYIYKEDGIKNFLDFLKIILSWPVTGIVAFYFFVKRFSNSIESFISRKELDPSFAKDKKQLVEPIKEVEKVEITSETTEGKIFENGTSEGTETEIKDLENKVELTEFKFLSLFLVHNTKLILKWFFEQKQQIITKEYFDVTWVKFADELNQREIIFNLLVQYNLIEGVLGGRFTLSEKGEKFLKHINFI